MAHWAEIDKNKIVIRVLVTDNNLQDEGESFVNSFGGTWIKTSYNGNIRKNFAGIGHTYDETLDAFIAPKCHEEAILDETSCKWNCGNEDHQ